MQIAIMPVQFFLKLASVQDLSSHLGKEGKEEETPYPLLSKRNCFFPMLGMQEASMKLTESLHEVYEPDWYGREDVKMVGEVRASHSAQEAWGGFSEAPTVFCSLDLSP